MDSDQKEVSERLEDWLKDAADKASGRPFKPYAHYSEDGDEIHVYLEDAPCNWSQANPYVGIGYADDDGRVVALSLAAPKRIIRGPINLGGAYQHRQRKGFVPNDRPR